jgi:hypothetical protein
MKTAEDVLDGQFNNHPAKLGYLAKADGSAILTHIIHIKNESTGAWFEAFVDAHSRELVSITDFRANASVGSLFLLLQNYAKIITHSCSIVFFPFKAEFPLKVLEPSGILRTKLPLPLASIPLVAEPMHVWTVQSFTRPGCQKLNR